MKEIFFPPHLSLLHKTFWQRFNKISLLLALLTASDSPLNPPRRRAAGAASKQAFGKGHGAEAFSVKY